MNRLLIISVMWVVACCAATVAAPPDDLLTSANRGHLWFVLEANKRSQNCVLSHHAADMDGPYFKGQATLSRMPIALASWGTRAWIVMPPKEGSDANRREVFTLQVRKEPALGVYMPQPAGRLDMVPSLPGGGRLASFIGTPTGPVALLLAAGVGDSPLQFNSSTDSGVADSRRALLLTLQNEKWTPVALPENFEQFTSALLVTGEDQRVGDLKLLAGNDERDSFLYRQQSDGTWRRDRVPLELSRVRSVVASKVGGAEQIAAVLAERGADNAEIVYLRNDVVLTLTNLGRPIGRWAIAAGNAMLNLLEHTSDGGLTIRDIHPISGQVSPRYHMATQSAPPGRVLQVMLMLLTAIAALLLLFFIKPSAAAIEIPADMEKAGMAVRSVGLAIDLAPAALITMVLSGCSLTDLFNIPLATIELNQSLPFVLMSVITVAHCAIFEAASGKSLGKMALGVHVVAAAGGELKAGRAVTRNAVKLAIMLIPPLALIGLMNSAGQGLHDIAARAVVVRPKENREE